MTNNTPPPYPADAGDGERMWAVDISSPAGQRAADLIHAIPGASGTKHLERLKHLFETDPDPGPVAIYQAAHGDAVERERSGSRTSSSSSPGQKGFDPATDSAPSTDRVRIKHAYDRARRDDLEEEAEFLRTIPFDHQRGFANFLFAEVLNAPEE